MFVLRTKQKFNYFFGQQIREEKRKRFNNYLILRKSILLIIIIKIIINYWENKSNKSFNERKYEFRANYFITITTRRR